MNDLSIKEIVLITGGADAIREHEYPGDYEVSVLIDFMPLPGNLFRRVRALVRDRRLAVFPATLVARVEINVYPLLGTVRGVNEALANNQGFTGGGGLPTGLRLEEAINLPNLYAQAPRMKPPKLPDGQKLQTGAHEVATGGESIAWEDVAGIVHHENLDPKPDPIERFLTMLEPLIKKMAETTAIPVQVTTVPGVDSFGPLMGQVDQMVATRDRLLRGEDGCGVPARKEADGEALADSGPTRNGSLMELRTSADRRERRVRLNLIDDEFRELVVWNMRQAMRDGTLHYMDASITASAIRKIADAAFCWIFSEIRNGTVITGRDVGEAP